MNKNNEIRVVTIKGLCDILKCNRVDYYRKYKDRLQRYPTGTRYVYFLEEDVLNLKKEIESVNLKVVC